MKSAERFITPELKAFRGQSARRPRSSAGREKELYEALLDMLIEQLPLLQATAAAIAELDVLACFAERAATLDCVRPELVESRCCTSRAAVIRSWSARAAALSFRTMFVLMNRAAC